MDKISVLFVDINKNGMFGISRYLSTLPDFELISKNELHIDASEGFIRYFGPEVIVIDTKKPDECNFNYLSQLVKNHKNSKVLLYTDADDNYVVEQAIEAGVAGYVNRKSEISRLIQAIKDVANGKYYFKNLSQNKELEPVYVNS